MLTRIHWIVIYSVDSVIQPLNNRGLVDKRCDHEHDRSGGNTWKNVSIIKTRINRRAISGTRWSFLLRKAPSWKQILLQYLLHPRLMVQHFKLQQNLSQLIVILNDLLCIRCLKNCGILLKHFHWLLNPSVHLSGPGYLAGDGR